MYKYIITKIWYDDEEIIQSETPLEFFEIRRQIDEQRIYCDEINIEEVENEDE